MSTAPTLTQSPDLKSAAVKETPAVTDAYRKAHKSYVLLAGLLASWELVGIVLNTKEKWGIELKSPEAVPLILFTLVFYSGYKMTIEWVQCDSERRRHFAAKLDYRVAHSIAIVAVWISVVQHVWHVRVVDFLANKVSAGIVGFALIVCFVMLGVLFSVFADRYKRREPTSRRGLLIATAVYLVATVVLSAAVLRTSILMCVFCFGIGSYMIRLIMSYIRKSKFA